MNNSHQYQLICDEYLSGNNQILFLPGSTWLFHYIVTLNHLMALFLLLDVEEKHIFPVKGSVGVIVFISADRVGNWAKLQ